jgi:hypothetical protein
VQLLLLRVRGLGADLELGELLLQLAQPLQLLHVLLRQLLLLLLRRGRGGGGDNGGLLRERRLGLGGGGAVGRVERGLEVLQARHARLERLQQRGRVHGVLLLVLLQRRHLALPGLLLLTRHDTTRTRHTHTKAGM